MAKPTPLSGFPELLPADRVVEQQVIATLARTFELHGFGNIETRAVEPMDQLLRKGETSKEVYVLKRLHDTDGDAGMGLHFDLTVPFARYVLENAGKLEFPFRRWQIQKVWRGERPQEGRFREFTQADIDIVGRDVLPFHHDVEVARVMVEALSQLEFLPGFRLQVNNRKLIQGFYEGVGASDTDKVMQVIDKLDKLPVEKVRELLQSDAGLDEKQADLCLQLATIESEDASFVEQVRTLGVASDLLEDGLAELAAVVEGCAPVTSETVKVVADLKIARGLDYYTGTVFETRLTGFEGLGSICSGGRYDALATDGRSTYPGVGISLGLSRLLVPLLQKGYLTGGRSVPSAVLVALANEESRPAADAVAQQLRRNGVPTEVAAKADKFGKQIKYAEKRGIPFVLFERPNADGAEDGPSSFEAKDIRTGEQVSVDPATWTPPATDLRPQVITKEQLS
ncbi:histidine--tRNA ligase [Nocardioides montaniterrae]